MRLPKLATLALAAACTVAAFADPSAGNRGNGGGRGFDRGGEKGGGGGERGGPGGWQGPGGDWNSEQAKQFRAEVEKFCEAHSPNRWADLKGALSSERKPSRLGGMTLRYAGLKQLQKEDPKLYDIKVKQIEIEDAEYGLLKQLKTSEDEHRNTEELRAKLRAKSLEYVAQRLEERNHRIERLKELVQKEQDKLANDQKDKDKLTDDRVKEMIAEGVEFFNPTPPPQFRRGEGGAGGGSGSAAPTTVNAAPVDPKR
jgi:hypothetical protein